MPNIVLDKANLSWNDIQFTGNLVAYHNLLISMKKDVVQQISHYIANLGFLSF